MSQLEFYKWVLNMGERAIKMLVDMYNVGMLAQPYAEMLEVIDGLPLDD
jgi:hypothetical protein